MASKKELQTILREEYGINKNISQSLAPEDCEQLLVTLRSQPSAVKLVDSFAEKNADLGNRNRHFGQLRSRAESKLETLQAEYQQLEGEVAELGKQVAELEGQVEAMEAAKAALTDRKDVIKTETQALEAEINRLQMEKRLLSSRVQTLTTQNDELSDANMELKKDNKELKNVVDQIRLRLARDTKVLLQYEDNELRKALIRLFRWTLG
ncbi:MAG: hypothetical protein ACFB16_01675 [Phormidesmis sp.]